MAIMKKKLVKKKTSSTASYQVSTKVVPQIVTDQERYEMNLNDLEDYLVRRHVPTEADKKIEDMKGRAKALQFLNKLGRKMRNGVQNMEALEEAFSPMRIHSPE